jgi:hypothetical protein
MTRQLLVALVLRYESMYGSCNMRTSHSLWTGEFIRSQCALADLLRFCCHMFNLTGIEYVVSDMRSMVGVSKTVMMTGGV